MKINKNIEITTVDTYYAHIFVGFRYGYNGPIQSKDKALEIIQEYCNEVKLGVTVEDVLFYYVNGNEKGIKVGLINYPRFPDTRASITNHAITLGKKLKTAYNQFRISVVTKDETHLIGEL